MLPNMYHNKVYIFVKIDIFLFRSVLEDTIADGPQKYNKVASSQLMDSTAKYQNIFEIEMKIGSYRNKFRAI